MGGVTILDPGTAAFLLVWAAPFFVAGMLGAWRAAAAIAAPPAAFAAWGLLGGLGAPAVERAASVDAALMVALVGAICAASYAAGRSRRLAADGEAT